MAKNEISRPQTAHIAPFGLRLQPELKERVEAAARANGRSMNAEIAARLEASFSGGAAASPEGGYLTAMEAMMAKHDEMHLSTQLQLAEMRAENADIATRGVGTEIRQLREDIEEAMTAGAPVHEIDELRSRLRMAEVVLPQHLEMVAQARRRVEDLRAQIEAVKKRLA